MKNEFRYTNSNKRYYTLDYFYKQTFGKKVYKISLNAGFTCPNKDGNKGMVVVSTVQNQEVETLQEIKKKIQ